MVNHLNGFVHADLGSLPCFAGQWLQYRSSLDSIEHLSAGGKAILKQHVQSLEFGASLDADCDEFFSKFYNGICQRRSTSLSAQRWKKL